MAATLEPPPEKLGVTHWSVEAPARHQELLAFLKQIERAYRHVSDESGDPVELHPVMDNYAAHQDKAVQEWLADDPRFNVHCSPTYASWMTLAMSVV